MSQEEIKLGYITKQSPKDVKAYSGIHYFMYQALKKKFGHVDTLGPLDDDIYKYIPKLRGKFLHFLTKKTFKYQYDLKLAKRASLRIDQKIHSHNPDVLLASLVSPEVAFLESNLPLYLTTDATFPLLKDLYASHSNLHPESINNAMELEGRAFQKAEKLLFPLQWIADSAIRDHGISANKIEVIPYGANIKNVITTEEFETNLSKKITNDTCKLLFIGVRWEEKGGPAAIETLKKLREKGIRAELTICGIIPNLKENVEGVHLEGFLDKEDPADYAKLERIFQEAHFFIFPTKAECVGISVLEAAAFGLPALTSNVGGMPEAIGHKENGFISEEPDDAEYYADQIADVWNNKPEYTRLSQNAYTAYKNKLNWDTWAERVREVIAS